jgi:membrane protease YdiL (CAAX protease family)
LREQTRDLHLVDLSKTSGTTTSRIREAKYIGFQIAGFIIVGTGMSILFLRPTSTYFVVGVFIATPVMILVTFWLNRYRGFFRPSGKSIGVGLLSSALLYGIFYIGNEFITIYKPLGVASSGEASIYGTIGSHPLFLQLIILLLDAIGFESYFRGNLQTFLSSRITNGKAKVGSAFLSALCDSLIHIISLNPLWAVTTFIADSAWGLTFYYTKDLGSSMTSHVLWDIVIFVVAPIR